MALAGQMVGFLAAALFNAHVSERFGLGKIIAIGGIVQACGYVFLIPAFPYPGALLPPKCCCPCSPSHGSPTVMPICYAVIGFGMALQDAQANTYIASRPNSDYKFGLLHASCTSLLPFGSAAVC